MRSLVMLAKSLKQTTFAIMLLTRLSASAMASTPQETPINLNSKACRDWKHFMLGQSKQEGGLKTDQLVVMRGNGEQLFNEAVQPYKKNTPHTMWSVSKMFTATLAATAAAEGKISLTDRVDTYLPVDQRHNPQGRKEYQALQIQDLIQMTSGLKWSEHNHDTAKQASDLPMMYSEGYRDFSKYVSNLDFDSKPGAKWNYSSANANLLMAILKKAYRGNYDKMPWKNLFYPLNMRSVAIEQDQAGNFIGGSYINMSAEDLAKFGQLFLNDGKANGKRVLPKGWVEKAKIAEPTSIKRVHTRADFLDFGVFSKGGWWLNHPVPGVGKSHPNSPENAMLSTGFLGQWLVVLPDENLVIARTGHDRESERKIDKMITGAIACFAKPHARASAHAASVR